MTSKGWAIAAMAWGVMAVLFVGITLWAVALGVVRLGLAGDEVQIRLSQCQLKVDGRGGSHNECMGKLVNGESTDTVKVGYDGKVGNTVKAAREPLGTYQVIDTSFTSWGMGVLYPLLPLAAAGLTTYLAARAARRCLRSSASSALS
ncbi:hypothetical protein ACIOTI_19155 [Streptomyces sp. NPDC087843]|uniref:hypothetical protein n=1 Tax=Streptomyces sp. NPDC087843 TaxID=3365804 RepID=UPI003813AEC7